MRKTSRVVLAAFAAVGLSLMGAAGSSAGHHEEAAQAAEAVKADAEKAVKTVEKEAKEKVDEVTYKKGEKPKDIYEETANPCAGGPADPAKPADAAKPANPCGGEK